MSPVFHWARVRPWWKALSLRSYERSVWLRRTAVETNCAAMSITSRAVDFVNSTDFGSGATSSTRSFVNGASLLCPVFEKKAPSIAAIPATARTMPIFSARLRLRGEEKKSLTPASLALAGVLGPDRRRLVRHPGGDLPLLAVLLQAHDERVRLRLRARLRSEDDGELGLTRVREVDLQRDLPELAEPRHDGDVAAQPLLVRQPRPDRRCGELPRLVQMLALEGGEDEPPRNPLRLLRHRHVLRRRARARLRRRHRRRVDRLRGVPEEDEQECDDPGHEHEGRDPRSQAREAPGSLQAGRIRRHALRVDDDFGRRLEHGRFAPAPQAPVRAADQWRGVGEPGGPQGPRTPAFRARRPRRCGARHTFLPSSRRPATLRGSAA